MARIEIALKSCYVDRTKVENTIWNYFESAHISKELTIPEIPSKLFPQLDTLNHIVESISISVYDNIVSTSECFNNKF